MAKIVLIWWSAAGLLLLGEMLIPGASLLWLGLAALATGTVLIAVPELPLLLQALLFGGFAAVAVACYLRWFRGREPVSDRPLLNQRAQQLVGREFVLFEPIRNGRGRLKIGDALWTVVGPELPAGTRVRITATDGLLLTVVAIAA
ncbi:MAG: NfeD family protein [Lysobacterales bacterium]